MKAKQLLAPQLCRAAAWLILPGSRLQWVPWPFLPYPPLLPYGKTGPAFDLPQLALILPVKVSQALSHAHFSRHGIALFPSASGPISQGSQLF